VTHPCPRYEPDLSAFLDGETTPARRAELETHLRSCEACRVAVAQLRGVSRALRRWDAQETRYATSSGFKNRVFAGIGVEEEAAPKRTFAWRAAAAVGLVAAGATAFALVAPRFETGESEAYRQLAWDIKRLSKAMNNRASAPTVRDEQRPVETAKVERLAPLEPVVDAPGADDDSATADAAPEIYEQRGDRRYLRDALSIHEDFARERDRLVLLEELRKMQEEKNQKPTELARPTQAAAAPSPLATYLGELRVASTSYLPFQKVQVWPIESTSAKSGPEALRAFACEKAIAAGKFTASENGSRDSVVVENHDAKRPVLVLAGDVLVGGRQDRVAREDALIGPGEQLSLSTYGSGGERRTSYTRFTECTGIAPQALRALAGADRALFPGGLAQEKFNDYVADTVRSLVSPSPLGSLDKLFSNPELIGAADGYVRNFEKRLDAPNVVGFAVSAGGRLLGFEAFGDHATFVDHRLRLMRSYVLAAIALSPDGTRLAGDVPSRDAVVAMVASAPKSVFPPGTPSGFGTLVVFRGADNGPFGFGLLDGSRVVHAALFTAVPEPPDAPGGGHAGGHRGAGDAPSGPETSHSGGARGGSSGDGAEGATDSQK